MLRGSAVIAIILPLLTCSAYAAQTALSASGAISPKIVLTPISPLSFGEIIVPDTALSGYFAIDETGAAASANATQSGTPTRGGFTLRGRAGHVLTLSIVGGPLACAPAFGACVGTPTVSGFTNTFTTTGTGQLSAASCAGVVCTDTVYFGGRLDFAGSDEGEWIGTVTVTAGYQ